ncbi:MULTISPECIES: LysR family transcriptional regulator [Rhodobacterales]|uniref:LysR family transcriptional regulator n=1 Tax=Roseobacter sp. N2S TaxID=2663844 RepID=UPI002854FBC9|nr:MULTISPECIES: LysR family transcriptional regulator [Rhodobacterales]MDR6265022.1 DNA-binding transcriptional LysR family regulator [Roseobacter sp. N2S]
MADREEEKFVTRLDWNLLRTFVVIVEEGSFTRAAHRLLRGQPSVSLALQRLELELNCQLIERGKGSFRLTAAGSNLYDECMDIFRSVSGLKEITTAASKEISGEISIHLASHVITPLLDDLLTETRTLYPNVTFNIKTATSATVTSAVMDRHASFGICLVNRKLPDLTYDLLYREFFSFYCGPPHPLFGRKNLTMEDLRGYDIVSFDTDDLNDALRPVALLRKQWDMAQRIVGRSSQLEEVRRMIQCGLGIGSLPIHVLERDVRDGLLWRLPPYSDPPEVDIFLVRNPKKKLNRAEQFFVARLLEQIKTMPLHLRTYPFPAIPLSQG